MKEIRSSEDIVKFIYDTIATQGKTVVSVERSCNLSNSSISKWKKNCPSTDKVITVLKHLGYTISISSDNEETGSLPDILVGEGTSDDSSIDLQIFETILRILKSESIELDKKKLLSILQLL